MGGFSERKHERLTGCVWHEHPSMTGSLGAIPVVASKVVINTESCPPIHALNNQTLKLVKKGVDMSIQVKVFSHQCSGPIRKDINGRLVWCIRDCKDL